MKCLVILPWFLLSYLGIVKNSNEHYSNFHARVFCKPQFENECVLKSSNNQFIVGTRFSSDYQQPQNNKSRFLL